MAISARTTRRQVAIAAIFASAVSGCVLDGTLTPAVPICASADHTSNVSGHYSNGPGNTDRKFLPSDELYVSWALSILTAAIMEPRSATSATLSRRLRATSPPG